MKILNLYACLGGNRYKWDEVTDVEVTAVEWDEELARLYQERFPNDKVIVADAHQYLLDHYKEFDFIWSSPPCPSHSRARFWNTKAKRIYPDLKLYEEILFLQTHYKGKYVVENVIPYYEPLIPAQKRHRHLYWTNFNLPNILTTRNIIVCNKEKDEFIKQCKHHEIDVSGYLGLQRKAKLVRNMVDYEAGKTILETVLGITKQNNEQQITMF
jgi:DNA (cytosine-5)-methyltransferase 1